jgi:serpin B
MRQILVAAAGLFLVAATGANVRAQVPINFVRPIRPPLEISPFPISVKPREPRPLPPPSVSTDDSAAITPHERAPLSADTDALVAGNNRFAMDIYRNLSAGANADKNVLVSPFSISSALAMTYAGARGRTAQQMADVLGFALPDDRIHAAFGQLLRDLTANRDGYELSIANRLFGQAGYPFSSPFLETTGRDYGAPLEPTNFMGNADGSRKHINQWVEDQTHGKIKNLLPDGSVREDMRLVLTNAIYFNGSWKSKFDADATHDDSFFAAGGHTSQVPMMFQQHSFLYAERPGYQILEMPYAGDDLAMDVILPTERDGLTQLESSLTPESLQQGLDALRSTTVNVTLPKFKFDSAFDLKDTLGALGMTDALDKDLANFRGMVDPFVEQLYIGMALHKSFIDVNEEGTEAAAATAIGIVAVTGAMPMPVEPKIFNADHPFLFALRDLHSGSVLFLGRVADPSELARASAAAVPEPASIALSVIAILVLAFYRRHDILIRGSRPIE